MSFLDSDFPTPDKIVPGFPQLPEESAIAVSIEETPEETKEREDAETKEKEVKLSSHAERELALLGVDDDQIPIVVEAVAAFVKLKDAGIAATGAIGILRDLMDEKTLSPLTDDPDEWVEVGTDVWQNVRNGEAFSVDGGRTYYLQSDPSSVFNGKRTYETARMYRKGMGNERTPKP